MVRHGITCEPLCTSLPSVQMPWLESVSAIGVNWFVIGVQISDRSSARFPLFVAPQRYVAALGNLLVNGGLHLFSSPMISEHVSAWLGYPVHPLGFEELDEKIPDLSRTICRLYVGYDSE